MGPCLGTQIVKRGHRHSGNTVMVGIQACHGHMGTHTYAKREPDVQWGPGHALGTPRCYKDTHAMGQGHGVMETGTQRGDTAMQWRAQCAKGCVQWGRAAVPQHSWWQCSAAPQPSGVTVDCTGWGGGGGNISFCPRLAEPWGKGLGRETEARRVLPHSFLPSISQEEL